MNFNLLTKTRFGLDFSEILETILILLIFKISK